MKYKLTLKSTFNAPSEVELNDDRIATTSNDCEVRFPWESHPYNVRGWVIGNEFGPLGLVWADCEQDAFDELCDRGFSDGLAIDEKDIEDEDSICRLGNAGEPHCLDNAWIGSVEFDPKRDIELIVALAEARGACQDTLEK